MATRIVSPNIWGWLADHTGMRMAAIRIGSLFGLLSFLAIFFVDSFAGMFTVIAAYSFFWNAVMPQFETLTLEYLAGQPNNYSKIRLWGSVGFIAAVVIGGYWFQYRIADFRVAGVIFLTLIWVATLFIRPMDHQSHSPSQGTFLQVVAQKPVIAFLLVSFCLQVAHGIYYTFFSLYLEDNGYQRSEVGWFWALSVIAEIGLFMVMHRLMANFSVRNILVVSLLLTVLRWLLIAFFIDSLVVLIVAQCLHALSFGACHAVSIEYLRRFFSGSHRGRGQAMYTSVSFGAGGAVGAIVGGLMWGYSGVLTFCIASGVTLVAALIAYRGLDYRSHQGQMREILQS